MNASTRFEGRGVTVVELLIVITIISILAAVILPVFTSASKQAKHSVCISNLRQIHAALTMYRDQQGDYPPNSVVWESFRAYYPTPLKCPASKQELQTGEFDYLLIGGPYGSRDRAITEAQIACREMRQGMYPIAMDINHLAQLAHLPDSIIIIARENGSVKVLPGKVLESAKAPCDELLLGPFLNL